DGNYPIPELRGVFDEGFDLIPAGIVHQDIDFAEGRQGGFNHFLNLAQARNIGIESEALGSSLLHHRNGFPGTLQFDVGHHYMRPQGPEFQSNTPSNSPTSAGYDRNLSFQVHVPPPFRRRYDRIS